MNFSRKSQINNFDIPDVKQGTIEELRSESLTS